MFDPESRALLGQHQSTIGEFVALLAPRMCLGRMLVFDACSKCGFAVAEHWLPTGRTRTARA